MAPPVNPASVTDGARPRWGALVAACLLAFLVAGVTGLAGLVGGGPFATAEPSATTAWLGWGVAGTAIAGPVAGLPSLGFRVRRAAACAIGLAVAVTITVVGYLCTMRDVV